MLLLPETWENLRRIIIKKMSRCQISRYDIKSVFICIV